MTEGRVGPIDVNGATLHYAEQGTGDAVVLVHGSASDHRTWEPHLDWFAEHFRTIVYSRRYHWPNDRIPDGADYSMQEHVDDLGGLVRSLGAAPAHLVGHSYGAFVCLLLAIQAPELVRSLVLAEPPAITLFVSNRPRPLELARLLFTRPRTAAAIVRFGAKGVAPAAAAMKRDDMDRALEIFAIATLGEAAFRRLAPARREQARANLIKAELLGSGFPPLDDEAIRRIAIPALLIAGQESPKMFRLLLDRLEELIPTTSRVEIPGASHIMHEDNPPVWREAVESFLLHTALGGNHD